jgi:phospholipid transport system substrate-binding protein
LFGVSLALAGGSPSWAGAPSDQLKSSVDEVIRLLEDPSFKAESRTTERRASLRKLADNIFDFGETARRALGPHWANLGDNDRQEFVSLFADLLERSYMSKIEVYSGEKIRYVGDAIDGEVATVKTRFVTKQGTEVPVDYRMLRRGDRWLVYDVVAEGVSLVNNYRTQFNKIIQSTSYQELVGRLKKAEPGAPSPGDESGRKAPRS